jgi:hypothetical protein
MSLQPINIFGFDNRGGLQNNKKPAWIPDNAFQRLENMYAWRDRLKKREGLKYLGRLQRNLTDQTLGTTSAGTPYTFTLNNIFTQLSIPEPNPELVPMTLVITVAAPDTASFTDLGNGNFSVTGHGVAAGSYVNYVTGKVVLKFSSTTGGAAITAALSYYPALPVMQIDQRELAAFNDEQTLWFDTTYAYDWNGTSFEEFIPGTTWDGGNANFFWTVNYRGIEPQNRLFFATNFVNDASDPIRYTDGITWTDFSPIVSGQAATSEVVGTIDGNGTTFTGTLLNVPIPGSVIITVAGITFDDPTGSGTLTGNPNTNSGTIDYTTGVFTLNFSPTINFDGTITGFTDANPGKITSDGHDLTTGAQVSTTGTLPVVYNSTYTITVVDDDNFTVGVNTSGYGASDNAGEWVLTTQSTNVVANYEYGDTYLFQALILIPYFGRMVALNVWEGETVSTAVQIYNRCRFSQTGNPIQDDAWRSDVFGKGGFLDAPTNEQIVSATFLNNTLIVFFERTTWQLRYVGEYGLPFIWERIASDFGSESTFAPVLFNEHIKLVGDKAILSADSNSVARIDLEIPDQIFDFQNDNSGIQRIHGIRDYQKELVYWNYPDAFTQAAPGTDLIFPNKVLLYNYRNNSWAMFRDSVTCFGVFEETTNITWNSTVVYWDSQIVTWDDFDTQSRFPMIVSGNQQGFVNFYQIEGPQGDGGVPANEQPSLTITAIALTNGVVTLTSTNHNLQPGEIVYITGMQFISSSTFLPVTTSLNNNLYYVQIVDVNTIQIYQWSFALNQYGGFTYTPILADAIYVGGGMMTLFPVPFIQTKDFNPYQTKGLQTKISYIDFMMDVTDQPPVGFIQGATQANPCVITSAGHGLYSGQQIFISGVSGMTQLNTSQNYYVTVIDTNTFSININSTGYSPYIANGGWILIAAGMSIQVLMNSSPVTSGNILVGNQSLGTTGNNPFFSPFFSQGSQYAWNRFYTTCAGQYFNIIMTYDNNLMNTIYTHTQDLTINAINVWIRQGGKILF